MCALQARESETREWLARTKYSQAAVPSHKVAASGLVLHSPSGDGSMSSRGKMTELSPCNVTLSSSGQLFGEWLMGGDWLSATG